MRSKRPGARATRTGWELSKKFARVLREVKKPRSSVDVLRTAVRKFRIQVS
jgi:hypothetical protein